MKQWAMFESHPSSYSGGICGFWGGTGCLQAFPVPAGGLPLCMGLDNQVAAVALHSPCWAFPPSKGPQCPVLCHIPATRRGYEAPSSAWELYQWYRELPCRAVPKGKSCRFLAKHYKGLPPCFPIWTRQDQSPWSPCLRWGEQSRWTKLVLLLLLIWWVCGP